MKYILALSVLVVAAVFIRTCPPTIYPGDSGEIVAAAYTLGIGHPPGYPLFMLCSKIFSIFPLGDYAFRVNFFSIFLSALVFIFLFIASSEFIQAAGGMKQDRFVRRGAAFLSAALFVFSSAFWFQGTHAKGGIYIFTQLVTIISIFSCLKYLNTKKIKFLYIAFYSAGFLVPSHPTSALFAVFIVSSMLYFAAGQKVSPGRAAACIVLFLTGFLTPYSYLFIRAQAGPVIDWAGISNQNDVMDHIFRKRYSEFTGEATFAGLISRLRQYILMIIKNYGILILFFIYGAYMVFKTSKPFFYFMAAFIILNTSALIYAVETQAGFFNSVPLQISEYISRGFYLINDIVPSIAAALGFFGLLKFISGKFPVNRAHIISLAAMAPLMLIFVNFSSNDQSMKFQGYDHAMNIMKTLNPGDILFSRGDCPTFNIVYLKYIKNQYSGETIYGRDRALLDISIYKKPWENTARSQVEPEARVLEDNPGRVFYTEKITSKLVSINSAPYGILFKAFTGAAKPDNSGLFLKLYTIRDHYRNRNMDIFSNDFIAKYLISRAAYAASRNDNAAAANYLALADGIGGGSPMTLVDIVNLSFSGLKDIPLTIKYMKKKAILNPDDMENLNILMDMYVKQDPDEALEWITRHYNEIPGGKDKTQVKMQIQALKRELEGKTK
jgi:hypothetical protein